MRCKGKTRTQTKEAGVGVEALVQRAAKVGVKPAGAAVEGQGIYREVVQGPNLGLEVDLVSFLVVLQVLLLGQSLLMLWISRRYRETVQNYDVL
jgi:hypothetical protein